MKGSYLGPSFTQSEIEESLREVGAQFTSVTDEALIEQTAQALADGKAVGWHQGRMEFGPRALGGRSILADPRSPSVQKQLNLKVKYRESFRPFAPSVLREHVHEWFDIDVDSPYMLLVAEVNRDRQLPIAETEKTLFGIDLLNVPRSTIPAVTHVDNSARIQTVHRESHPRYHQLITRFKEKTGCPVLVNTSFNVRGEPIVCTPQDAFRCLMGTEIEWLAIGNCIVKKEEQDPRLVLDYKNAYELD
jgi:carbamoyltransferase